MGSAYGVRLKHALVCCYRFYFDNLLCKLLFVNPLGLVTPYRDTHTWVNIGSGNGLLPGYP